MGYSSWICKESDTTERLSKQKSKPDLTFEAQGQKEEKRK